MIWSGEYSKMPLFKSSPKSPQDLVKSLRDALQVLNTTEAGGKKSDKVNFATSRMIRSYQFQKNFRLLKKLLKFWFP